VGGVGDGPTARAILDERLFGLHPRSALAPSPDELAIDLGGGPNATDEEAVGNVCARRRLCAHDATAGASTDARDVFRGLLEAEVRERRCDAVDLAPGHAQLAANHLERGARQPAVRLLNALQRGHEIRPLAREGANAVGEVRLGNHGRILLIIAKWPAAGAYRHV
jgi:hypothetical protein